MSERGAFVRMSLSLFAPICPACLLPHEKAGECLRCALTAALTAVDCQQNGRQPPDMEHLSPDEFRWLPQSAPTAPVRECHAA
jgi:hypothetical protein